MEVQITTIQYCNGDGKQAYGTAKEEHEFHLKSREPLERRGC